jgi:hypothetical protein
MAIVGFLLGSVLGTAFGLIALYAFDMTTWKAFVLYVITALTIGILVLVIGHLRRPSKDEPSSGTVRN